MKFTTILEKFDERMGWGYHIIIPNQVAQSFLTRNKKRVICTINGGDPFHCALNVRRGGDYFIYVNKERCAELRLAIGDELEGMLMDDNSEYGMPVPEEMAELLLQDQDGSQWFHALSPGKQRSLLFMVGKPKTSATRLRKAITIIEYLKQSKGEIDFQTLNEAYKNKTYVDF